MPEPGGSMGHWFPEENLEQWFSEWGLQTDSISITQKLGKSIGLLTQKLGISLAFQVLGSLEVVLRPGQV